jgi:STAS domain
MQRRVHGRPLDEVFSISGVFDPIAAARFRARFAELPRDAPVVLDFSAASEVSDLALWVLLAAPRHPCLALRGLTQHHERMLRYLGLEGSVLRRARDDADAWADEGEP